MTKADLPLKLALTALLLPALAGCPSQPGVTEPEDGAQKQASGSTRSERCKARLEQADGGRIVGGEPARPRSAPWQVAIMSSPEYTKAERSFDNTLEDGDECKNYLEEREDFELAHKCGGSYIGDGWIVTAARK